MRFKIEFASGKSPEKIRGTFHIEQLVDCRWSYVEHLGSRENQAFFKTMHANAIVGEYEEDGERGLLYREDRSYWAIEVADLEALVQLSKTLNVSLVLDGRDSSVIIYDGYME